MGTGQHEKMRKTTFGVGLCSNCYKRALKGLEMKSLATQSSKRKENKAKLYFENSATEMYLVPKSSATEMYLVPKCSGTKMYLVPKCT